MPFHLIRNEKRIGTALSVNKGWQHRLPGEHCVKADSDIVWRDADWLNRLEEVVQRDPNCGIVGCKRYDLLESPNAPKGSWSHSDLMMIDHKPGQNWIVVECARHILGSCTLYNSALLDKIGYLVQFGAYGLDDSIACTRSEVCGFYNCFLPHLRIEHPDPGGTPYQDWKQRHAGECLPKFDRLRMAYKSGKISPYHDADTDLDKLLEGWK